MKGAVQLGSMNLLNSALLVVDMQNDYCHPLGSHGQRGDDLSNIQAITEKMHQLIRGCRKNELPLIYIQTIHEQATDSESWLRRSGGRSSNTCRVGTWGAEFYEIKPEASDVIVNKHRYSAFIYTRLETVLHTYKVDTLILCGVTTNVCVDSTARHGFMLDFNVIIVSDACAAYDTDMHDATLKNMARHFGTVLTTDELINNLGG